jgi:hypothetical protein
MKKSEALTILHNSAKAYQQNLVGRNIIFIADNKKNGILFPKTILKDDLRRLCTTWHRIVAVFSKKRDEVLYSNLEYLAKGAVLEDLLTICPELATKLNVEGTLV